MTKVFNIEDKIKKNTNISQKDKDKDKDINIFLSDKLTSLIDNNLFEETPDEIADTMIEVTKYINSMQADTYLKTDHLKLMYSALAVFTLAQTKELIQKNKEIAALQALTADILDK